MLETDLFAAFQRLRAEAARSVASPVLIFVSTGECDSVCGLQIITSMLKSESLAYSVFPVSGYRSIRRHAERLKLDEQEDHVVVVMLNCGATEPVASFIGLGERSTAFVIDSHRPIDHRNANDHNRQVVVLCTQQDRVLTEGFLGDELRDPSVLDESGEDRDDDDDGDDAAQSSSDEGEGGDQDDHREAGEGEGGGAGRRKRRAHARPGRQPRRRRAGGGTYAEVRRRRQERHHARASYYLQGTSYGRACGLLAFDVAHQVRKDTNDLLWLAIISLTDQKVHGRVASELYLSCVAELQQHVTSFGNDEAAVSTEVQDEHATVAIRLADAGRITFEQEFQFMQMRHWSVFEAMEYSPYVATRLRTWRQAGKDTLQRLLAKMGVPLAESQQKFAYMSLEVKRKFREKLEEFGPQFDLRDLTFPSFQRSTGFTSVVSAADMVYSLTALLEIGESDQATAEYFWTACKALTEDHTLQVGLEKSGALQKATLRIASLMAQLKVWNNTMGGFLRMELPESGDEELLAYPLALTRLTRLVMDVCKREGRNKKKLPFVVVAPRPNNLALILGVTFEPTLDASGNKLSLAFRMASERLERECTHPHFDLSIVEVARPAVRAFLDYVNDHILS